MRTQRPLAASATGLLGIGCLLLAGATANGTTADAGKVTKVSTADELKDALSSATAGETIRLADGTYRGNFTTTKSGSDGSPITLTGSRRAVLTADGGYGLHLDGAAHWNLDGFTVTGGQKGIVLDASDDAHLDGLSVHGLDMEGVHWRKSSSGGSIENSEIHDTGKNGSGAGEGVYIGSAGGTDDKSDNVLVENNTIGPHVGGENIDVKEGTTGTKIVGNTFDGNGLTGANYDDSWVDVKGNKVRVEKNTGKHTTNDGFEVHSAQDGWGCGSVFKGNKADLSGASGRDQYAINVTDYDADNCPATVADDNTVKGGKGLANPGVPVG